MNDYTDDEARIDSLHDEAEYLADLASNTDDEREAERLRKKATTLVRRAARLREEAGL